MVKVKIFFILAVLLFVLYFLFSFSPNSSKQTIGTGVDIPQSKDYMTQTAKEATSTPITTPTKTVNTRPVLAPVIESLTPNFGPVGIKVEVKGKNFTEKNNTVSFTNSDYPDNVIPNIPSDGTTLTFIVPVFSKPACTYSTPACVHPYIRVFPGVYIVSVINSNGKSNSLNFTIHFWSEYAKMFMNPVHASPTGVSLSLTPNTTSVAPNGTFTVNVILNTSGQSSAGVDLNKLRFNPAILQVVDSNTSLPGVQIAPGTIMPTNVANTVDNTQGTITFSQLTNPGTTYTGTGTLATITFRAIASGSSNVTFDFTSGSGIDTNVAGNGVDILQSVGNGSYSVK